MTVKGIALWWLACLTFCVIVWVFAIIGLVHVVGGCQAEKIDPAPIVKHLPTDNRQGISGAKKNEPTDDNFWQSLLRDRGHGSGSGRGGFEMRLYGGK